MSYDSYKTYDAAELRGKTITAISQEGDEIITITTAEATYRMIHHQDCCESVRVHSVVGDLQWLVGLPLIVAEESVIKEGKDWPADMEKPDYLDCWTITIYSFATALAKVQIRWLGESNGYYSESVDINRIA
jgi:hypothetical protein